MPAVKTIPPQVKVRSLEAPFDDDDDDEDDAEEGEGAELACVRGDSSVDAVEERVVGVEAVVDADTLAVVEAASVSPEVSGT